MKGIYLAAFKAKHENYNIIYQDINGKRDIGGDMLETPLDDYDFIIATPPCNYWSKANYRRETSEYAQKTKHLLGDIIDKLIKLNKPFIIENVRNRPLMNKYKLLSKDCYIYEHGRHTYWTNIFFNEIYEVEQGNDLVYKPLLSGKKKGKMGQWDSQNKRQGGKNVHNVIEKWLEVIHERK